MSKFILIFFLLLPFTYFTQIKKDNTPNFVTTKPINLIIAFTSLGNGVANQINVQNTNQIICSYVFISAGILINLDSIMSSKKTKR